MSDAAEEFVSSEASAEATDSDDHARHARAVAWGTVLALVSAVLYTATNMCLRAVVHCDPYWVSCLKALPTLAIAAALVAAAARRGRWKRPGLKLTAALTGVGLLAHIGGNVAFQWGLGIVGLAAAVPLTFSVIIVAGALLGRFYLGEGITYRSAGAMALLCGSIALLGVHTERVHDRVGGGFASHDAWTTALAIVVTCFSGFAYSMLGVTIRRTTRGEISSATVLLVISVAGVASLGAMSGARLGATGILATTPRDWAVMLGGGMFNAVAFFLLTRALQLVPIAYVNVVNASQTAMAAVAGVVYFGESSTWALFAGVGIMVAGIGLMDRPRRAAS